MNIIMYLIQIIQQLYKQYCWLILFICKYIPLKQWAYDDFHSPKYQKYKVDELPIIKETHPHAWTYRDLIPYYQQRYRTIVSFMIFPYLSSTPPETQALCLSGKSIRRPAAYRVHGPFYPSVVLTEPPCGGSLIML